MMLLLFAVTLLTSATLMFWIEPMFAKMVLPLLGGAPMVWNTCMVFYQIVLLAGYVYAHFATKSWGTRKQAKIHLLGLCTVGLAIVLVTSLFFLPIRPGDTLGPRGGDNPILWLMVFMLLTIGFPLFVVSASAPMLQAWFADTGHKAGHDPYFLYAASNLGSMGALIAYPLVIEPNLPLRLQTWCWAGGFVVLIALTACCAMLLWRSRGLPVLAVAGGAGLRETGPRRTTGLGETGPRGRSDPWTQAMRETAVQRPAERPAAAPTLWLRLRWLALAMIPSSLLLGVTTYASTDVASFPLMWIIPLALYLFTFVLVFSRLTTLPYRLAKAGVERIDAFLDDSLPSWLAAVLRTPLDGAVELLNLHRVMVLLQPLVLVMVLYSTATAELSGKSFVNKLLFHLVAFFVTAMVCHGELARTRPAAKYLTEFYLWMSVGGMLGGMFNALAAPLVFDSVVEYPLMIGAACLLRPQIGKSRWPVFSRWMDVLLPTALFTLLVGLLIANRCTHPAHKDDKSQPVDQWHRTVGDFLPKGHWVRPTNQWLNEVLPLPEANAALPRRFVEPLARWFGPTKPTLKLPKASDSMPEGNAKLEERRREVRERYEKDMKRWESEIAEWQLLPAQWNLNGKAALLVLGVVVVFLFQFRPIRFGLGVLALGLFFGGPFHDVGEDADNPVIYQTRSPFGVIRVLEYKRAHVPRNDQGEPDDSAKPVVDYLRHTLLHGTTDHGNQRFDDGWRSEPISYYFRANALSNAANSPLAAVFERLIDPSVHDQIGVCGLGTGTTAAYGQKGQTVIYFEIDPAVVDIDTATVSHNGVFRRIAVSVGNALGINTTNLDREGKPRFHDPISGEDLPLFTFKRDAEERGVKVDVKLGDARQTLEDEADGKFDLLVIDAFNSDAIPIHLLTKEAIQLYLRKLKEDGVLMVHISNRHLKLAPVVGNIAKALVKEEEYPDLAALWCNDSGDDSVGKSGSDWIAIAQKSKRLAPLRTIAVGQRREASWEEIPEYQTTVIWTDDFSNIIDVLNWRKELGWSRKATLPVGETEDYDD